LRRFFLQIVNLPTWSRAAREVKVKAKGLGRLGNPEVVTRLGDIIGKLSIEVGYEVGFR
jgi:hypothetical protein